MAAVRDGRFRTVRGNRLSAAACALSAVFLAAALVASPDVALAQPPTAAQEGFVPVTDVPPEEQLPAAPLVMAAYGFAWMAVVVYIWSLWRRLGRVEREMAAVSRRLESGSRQ